MMYFWKWNNYNAISSMDIACRPFGIQSPKKCEAKGETVVKSFEEGNIEAKNDYVMQDVETTHRLFEKVKKNIS